MKQVNIADFKSHLSEYLAAVEAGETLTISRHNLPIAEISPVGKRRQKPRPIGLARGKVKVHENFNDPLPDDLLAAFEGK